MKKTLFLSAILGAALCSSAFAATPTISGNDVANINLTGYTVNDTVTLNVTGSSYFIGSADYTHNTVVANLIIENLNIANGWSNNHSTQEFTGTITGSGPITRTNSQNTQYWIFSGDMANYTGAVTMGNAENSLTFGAAGQNRTVGASSVTMNDGAELIINGDVTFTQATIGVKNLTINGSMTIGSNATLNVTTGSDWTISKETKVQSGNGFSSAIFQKDFGPGSIIAEEGATFQVNGGNAVFENGVLKNITALTTKKYYLNDAGQTINFSKAEYLEVGATTVTLTNGVSTLDDLVINGGTVTLSLTEKLHGNLHLMNNGKATLTASDKLEFGQAGKGKSITVEAGSTLDMGSNRFSMGFYTVDMQGGEITGNGEGSNGALDFHQSVSHDAIVASGETASTISAAVRLRTGVNVNVAENASLKMSGLINGGNGLTKKGAGTLTLSHASNTFTGGVTVSEGKLIASTANTLGTGATTVDGGELSLSARQEASSFTVNNGGTLSLTQTGSDKKNGLVANGITVNGGGTLASMSTDTLGYTGAKNDGSPTHSVTLSGTSTNQPATWTMTHRQTVMGTNITLEGNTAIKAAARGAATDGDAPMLDYHGGTITLSGTNNVISVKTKLNNGTMAISNSGTQAASLNFSSVEWTNNSTLKVTGAKTSVQIANFDYIRGMTTNIVLGNEATITLPGNATWLANSTFNVKHNDDGTGGTLNFANILFGYTGGNASTLNVESATTVKVTGKADGTSGKGFIIWNGEAHTFNVAGTLAILDGMSVNAANSVFNITKTGVLQLNNGITFVGCNGKTPSSLGTINVMGDNAVGGTLAIGGTTTGSKATVTLFDGSKVVAIDSTTSTEQVFTLSDSAEVTFSGKGLKGTDDNTLTVNSNISNSTATVHSVGKVNFANVTTNSLTVDGTTTVGALTTPEVIMKADASLTMAGAHTTINTLTLNNGSTVTLGSEDAHDYKFTTSALTVNGDANINANLVMNGGTLTFADNAVLTMGCDVTIGKDVTVMLTDTMVESIQAGNWVQIIAGVDKADLSQSLTFAGSGTLSNYVNEHAGVYQLTQIGNNVYITPEPATATLSLLALAALAARRKRH